MSQTPLKYLRIISVTLLVIILGAAGLSCGTPTDDIDDWYTSDESDTTDWFEETEAVTQPDITGSAPVEQVNASVDRASSDIGVEGGKVVLEGGATLSVPANTLTETASVSLEQFENPGDFGQDATVFDITGLSGVNGNVELTLPVEEGMTKEEVDVYGYITSGEYFKVPYVYNAASHQVTVTINPSNITAADAPKKLAGSGVSPSGVQMAIAQNSGTISVNPAGVFERISILFTPQHAYVPQTYDKLIQLPFYEQSGGSCWAADTEMILAGYLPADQRQHLGKVLFSAKASDDDFGLTGGWINFQEVLPRYISAQTGTSVTWRGFVNVDHLKWRLLEELDANHPVILELPGIGHYVLLVGYQNSGESFILQDSKGTSPVDSPAPEGGMYTVRPWSWIAGNKGGLVNVVHIMWTGAPPCPASLISIACPAGSENGGSSLGTANFYYINPKVNHQVPVATLQYSPSNIDGLRWQERLVTVPVIPHIATNFGLSTKLWNADFQDASVEVKVQVRKDADVIFTRSLGTYNLPAANYGTTTPVTVTGDILTADFRDLSKADAKGNLPVYIDVMVMQGSTISDSFTIEAVLDVNPKVESINPTSVKPRDLLNITGSCFGKTETSKSEVVIDNETMDVISWSDTLITVQIPDDFDLSGNVLLNVRTGVQNTYESNSIPLTASANQPAQVTRNWNIVNTSIEGVMDARFNWILTGTGETIIDQETEGDITIEVLPGVPFQLTVNSYATMQNPEVNSPSGNGWYWIKTYGTPALRFTTEDRMLDFGGVFTPIFNCNGGSTTIDFTFAEEFDYLELTLIYDVKYDQTLYDPDGVAQDTQTGESEWSSIGVIIKIEAYEPDISY
jgi:hypothetical protein